MSRLEKLRALFLIIVLGTCLVGISIIDVLVSFFDVRFIPAIHILSFFMLLSVTFLIVAYIKLVKKTKNDQYEYEMSTQELLKVIEKKCDDAKKAELKKADFLASMSHEMRSPLNAMLGFNEMILRNCDDEQIRSYSLDVASSGQFMTTLVNDILDYSKVESGRMEINPIEYDLSNLIHEISNAAQMKAKEKGIDFILNADSALPKILTGDAIRIKQVINNLITESIEKLSEGTVTLTINYVKIDDKLINLKVSVKDDGIGMNSEELENVIIPFGQLDGSKKLHIDSLALNMTISQELLSLMNTKLGIRTDVGIGTTYYFNVKQAVESWEQVGNISTIKTVNKNTDEAYKPSFSAPSARILIVDDIAVNISVITELLKDTQIKIETVYSGQAAVDACRDQEYHLILLDHKMPGMSGIETLKKLRADWFSKNRYVPVIAMTANAVSGAKGMFIKEGFSDYITKPMVPKELEKMIIKYLPDELICDAVDVVIEEPQNELISKLRNSVFTINVDDGIRAAGSEKVYNVAISEFYITLDQTINEIKTLFDSKDIEMYVIKVHALKSTARLIGAMELSEMAKELEFAGKDGKIDVIEANTDTLLDELRILKQKLSSCFESDEKKDLPMISDALLKEAVDVMTEGAECFDYDMIETVMQQLAGYSVPDSFVDTLNELKVLMANVAFEEIKSLLKSIQL